MPLHIVMAIASELLFKYSGARLFFFEFSPPVGLCSLVFDAFASGALGGVGVGGLHTKRECDIVCGC